MNPSLISLNLILVAASYCGCGHTLAENPYHSSTDVLSDVRQHAVDTNHLRPALVEQDSPEEVEAASHEVLPADNRYTAAVHSDAASALEPDAIEPLVNLGDLHTPAGWLKEIACLHQEPLRLVHDTFEAIGRLAHVCLEVRKEPLVLEQLLAQLATGPGDQEWKSWARNHIGDLADTSK